MASSGYAQTAAAPAPTATADSAADAGIADIVVTATRSSANLQSVPIAVSAFTNRTLEERQITNTSKLIQSIPNTTFTKGNFSGSNLTIRGIGSAVVATSGDTGVGIHINDMPLVAPRLFETEFYDVQRIEVLRGPQGTLYGRNATAGVMNVITNKADPKGLAAFGELQYGNYNAIKATGMVNVPISDKIAVRVAGLYVNRDGYITNVWNDTQVDGRNSYALRGAIHFQPTEALTIDLMGSYFNENSDRMRVQNQLCLTDPTGVLGCQPNGLAAQKTNGAASLSTILTSQELLRIKGFGALSAPLSLGSLYGPNAFTDAYVSSDPYKVATQFTPTYQSNELILMGNVEYAWDKATLSLIGGYSQNMVNSRQDTNLTVDAVQTTLPTNIATLATYFPAKYAAQKLLQNGQLCISNADTSFTGYIGGNLLGCSNRQQQYDQSDLYTHQWSGEAHVQTHLDGMVNFLVGGIYTTSTQSSDYFVVSSALDYASLIFTGPAVAGLASPFYDNRTTSYTLNAWAGFGEAYVQFRDNLKLTLGLRYTSDSKSVQDVVPQPLLTQAVPLGTTSVNVGSGCDPVNPEHPAVGFNRCADQTTNAWTGRALLQWTPTLDFTDSTMVYASYSRGFKGGGINPAFDPSVVVGAKVLFEPEYVNAFEVGVKNRLLGGTLQANFTGFYYDYQGLQISRIIARSSFNDNTNATVYGIEAEFVIQPVRALQFDANISWLHTAIKDLTVSDARDPSGGRSDVVIIKDVTNASNCAVIPTAAGVPRADALVNAVNAGLNKAYGAGLKGVTAIGGTNAVGAYSVCSALAAQIHAGGLPYQTIANPNGSYSMPDGVAVSLNGNQLQNSPTWKFAVGAQYNFDLSSSVNGFIRADYNFTGNQYGRNYNDFADRIPAYGLANIQAQINGGNGRYYVRAFVQNVFNSTAITGMYLSDASTGLYTNVFTLDPRTYGLAIGFHY